ncbi:MAG: phenylacetate--CoA ligase family protein [Bacteroidota bacterium]
MIFYLLRYTLGHYFTKALPVKRVQKIQVRKFNKLLDRALDKSQFYREMYKNVPAENLHIRSIDDLKRLPVISKDDMRNYTPEQIITRNDISKLIKRSTSGSTGKPFDTYLNKKEYFTSYFRTFFTLKKYNPFKRFVLIGVFHQKEQIERKSFMHYAQKYLGLFRREAYTVFTPTDEIIEKLQDRKIHILSSTPSYLKILTDELKKRNIKLNVKYVVLFGETLFQDVRKGIESWLQAQIIDVYGCMEHPTLAWTDPGAQTYHYPLHSVILEYVNPIKINGEIFGELVITNLVNKTMPFIRYKIGDHVKILDNNYKKMGRIIGRVEDVIQLKTGEKLYRQQVWSVFRDFTECRQFRLLQKKNGQIFFQAILKDGFDEEQVKSKILKIWKSHFSAEPPQVEFLDELPITNKSGKFKNIEVEK